MRMRLGLAVGAAVGYVLGARAGQERYEDLKRAAGRVADNPIISSASALVRGKAEKVEQAVAEKIDEVQEPEATQTDLLVEGAIPVEGEE
jgi:hypothetical protein